MVRSEKKYVTAWTHAQARHFAQTMGWSRSEWAFVSKPEQIQGLYGVILYEVRAPRYRPNKIEQERAQHLWNVAVTPGLNSGRIIKLNVVNLP